MIETRTDGLKTCSKCREVKGLAEFGRDRSKWDGLTHACKPCSRAYYLAHHRVKRRENPERIWENVLRLKYGITLAQFQELEEAQGGVCAICSRRDRRDIRLSVDHDHVTGQVRGLLCQTCNLGLGYFKDSPDFLVSAKNYLLRERTV